MLFILITVVTFGSALAAVLLINWWIGRQAAPYIYTSEEQVPPRKVAIVLGAAIRGPHRLSAMLEDRVQTAVNLYKAGKVEKLLMTGDNSATNYDEVSAMRRYALKQGVNSDDVIRDFAGFRTYDSMYRARDLWGLRSFVIVTQDFHLARSVYTARKLGVDAVGLVADKRDYSGGSLRRATTREVAARVAAWLEVNITHPKPKFLGDPETLSGDEQTSRVETTNP